MRARPGGNPILTNFDMDPNTEWVDLSRHVYRWIV
jgi:hypothetical protein